MPANSLPPHVTRKAAGDIAKALREIADSLDYLASTPGDLAEDPGWGLQAADAGLAAMAAGEVMADSGMAVAALEGKSLRQIGEAVGFAFSAIPRRLAGTPELADYAEAPGDGHPRVTQGGIERARYDLRQGTYTVEGAPDRVQKRRRRG